MSWKDDERVRRFRGLVVLVTHEPLGWYAQVVRSRDAAVLAERGPTSRKGEARRWGVVLLAQLRQLELSGVHIS